MLQKLLLTFLCVHALQAAAAGKFDFLPSATAPEKEFQSLMESGNFAKALGAFETVHRTSGFGRSDSGVATWAYLVYQNGLPYTALEALIHNTKPRKLDPRLLQIWSIEMKNSTLIQKGWVTTTGGWKAVVDNGPLRLSLTKKSDIAKAFARADALAKENVNLKARIWWQIANQAPQIGDIDASLKALKLMRESGQSAIGQDQVAMTQGRVLYQKGDLAAAVNSWLQIPKGSSLWVEAVEERAWAHLRGNDYDRALGDVTTALSPVLAPLAGPETYFLANLMALRVCDYPSIFKNSETFKKRHRQRLIDLQELANKGTNRGISPVFASFEQKGVSQEVAGPLVDTMPRGLFRDSAFLKAMESRRQILAEIAKAGNIVGPGPLSEGRNQAERYRQEALLRARGLAQRDLKEYRMVLNKMHIIEGEVIERLNLDENLKGQRSKLSKTDDKGDVLVFPYTAEVWMDELNNYKARVKDCPTLKGASL